ncbi:MAG: translation initiation factor IF-2 [Ahrensia sp.]|nr:translation initiation factor IF-2 [Ahrensia sp.]
MSDTTDDKKTGADSKRTLTLKRSGGDKSTVRQNFSHGRSKSVVVETRKRKFTRPDEKPASGSLAGGLKPRAAAPEAEAPKPEAPKAAPKRPAAHDDSRGGVVLNQLSQNEMDARRRALEEAKAREVEDRQRAAEDAKRRAEEDERRARERAESKRRQREEEERLAAEKAARERAEAEAAKRAPEPEGEKAAAAAKPAGRRPAGDEEESRGPRRGGAGGPGKTDTPPRPSPRRDDERRRGKLTLSNVGADGEGRSRSLSAMRRRQEKFKRSMSSNEPREKISREVQLPETITIQELAQRMAERAVDVVKFLMKEGQMMKPGDLIDADLAELIAEEFGHTVRRVTEADVEEGIFDIEDKAEDMKSRPPVVTIMGHVDHGKTSLLDAIREANVVKGEAGGITQHIGAYQVEKDGQKITFLDTPGHAAFTAMRARGAQATDIAILVVAADDSVMPQTIESINHIKAAGVPMIVAINKIDKPDSDAQKVRTELLQHEVFVESMGGDVQEVEVSALKHINLDGLLEAILLQSEVLELKANPDRTAEGVVIEAKLDKGRGSVATVLVQAGTLRTGDIVVAGDEWGRVRAIINDRGDQLKEAEPSLPVEILGLNGTPQAGDKVAVVDSEARAREISEYRQRVSREKAVARQAGSRGSLEQMMAQAANKELAEFPLLIKADVQGSVEAILGALDKLGTDEVQARIVHSGAGGITETDVTLAESTGSVIMAFNVRANKQARDLAEQSGVEIRYYNIIYNLLDDVKAAMSGLLSPERRETFLGNAEILEVFNITKVGKVAGCKVTEGKVERGAGVRLVRDNVVIHEGKLKTLKRFKDEVSEVPVGQECGMAFENYDDIRAGDVIECFRVEEIARSL